MYPLPPLLEQGFLQRGEISEEDILQEGFDPGREGAQLIIKGIKDAARFYFGDEVNPFYEPTLLNRALFYLESGVGESEEVINEIARTHLPRVPDVNEMVRYVNVDEEGAGPQYVWLRCSREKALDEVEANREYVRGQFALAKYILEYSLSQEKSS